MKFRSIPQIPISADPQTKAFLAALKENFEIMAGQRGGRISALESSATNAEIIAKINEIINRLQ